MTGLYGITLWGALTGPIWWPVGEMAAKKVRWEFPAGRRTLREHLLGFMAAEGGDFQWCKFTGDSHIVIDAINVGPKRFRTYRRTWDLTSFKSIADLIDADVFENDFNMEE